MCSHILPTGFRIKYVCKALSKGLLFTLFSIKYWLGDERLYIQQFRKENENKKFPWIKQNVINQKIIWDTISLRFALLVGIRLCHFYLKRCGPNSKQRTIWVYSHFINRWNNRNIHSFTFSTNIPWAKQHPGYILGNTTVKKSGSLPS